MCELRNLRLLVKNKATGTPLEMYCSPLWLWGVSHPTPDGIKYIGVGLSALLVSTRRAMRRPTHRGTGKRSAPRLSVYANKLKRIMFAKAASELNRIVTHWLE